MKTQKIFDQAIADLETIPAHLQLRLTVNPESIFRQTQQIASIQLKLEHVKVSLEKQLGSELLKKTVEQKYLKIVQLVDDMIQYGDALKLLAEEHPVDPEGTSDCLASLRPRKFHWMEVVQHLKTKPSRPKRGILRWFHLDWNPKGDRPLSPEIKQLIKL